MAAKLSQSRTLSCKPDFDECMARICAWYEQKIVDRPPVRFHHHNIEYERHRTIKGPWKTPEDRWLDVEFQVQSFVDSLAGSEFLGETFPVFWPNLSAVAYNLFLGQPAEFDDVTAWTHPCVENLETPPALGVQWNGLYFRTIEALTRRALEAASDRFLVGYTDMYAGIDCTAGLRGAQNMCMDMLEEPEALKKLIDLAFGEYHAVYNHFDRLLKQNSQLSVTWMNLPSYDTFNVLACDFSAIISSSYFDEFCLPVIRREAEMFRHNVFHLDGPGVARHLDSILTLPNLVAVQWVQGYSVDAPIMQWVPLIKKIQSAGKSVIVDLQPSELDEFVKAVDPTGVMLWINAGPESQREILARVKRW